MGIRPWHMERSRHHKDAADHIAEAAQFEDWAVVALFYSAHELVHSCLSGQPGLSKDERHPRKHTSHKDPDSGGRGTNQLVRAYLRPIYMDYINLFEASRRTRYDMNALGPDAYEMFLPMHKHISDHVQSINSGRPDIPSEQA